MLAAQDLPGFSNWGMPLLFGQLADPSHEIIQLTCQLLHRWIPVRLIIFYLLYFFIIF